MAFLEARISCVACFGRKEGGSAGDGAGLGAPMPPAGSVGIFDMGAKYKPEGWLTVIAARGFHVLSGLLQRQGRCTASSFSRPSEWSRAAAQQTGSLGKTPATDRPIPTPGITPGPGSIQREQEWVLPIALPHTCKFTTWDGLPSMSWC